MAWHVLFARYYTQYHDIKKKRKKKMVLIHSIHPQADSCAELCVQRGWFSKKPVFSPRKRFYHANASPNGHSFINSTKCFHVCTMEYIPVVWGGKRPSPVTGNWLTCISVKGPGVVSSSAGRQKNDLFLFLKKFYRSLKANLVMVRSATREDIKNFKLWNKWDAYPEGILKYAFKIYISLIISGACFRYL